MIHPDGKSIFVVGGYDHFNSRDSVEIAKLECPSSELESCGWTVLEQKIKYPGRKKHLAFAVHGHFNCTLK